MVQIKNSTLFGIFLSMVQPFAFKYSLITVQVIFYLQAQNQVNMSRTHDQCFIATSVFSVSVNCPLTHRHTINTDFEG